MIPLCINRGQPFVVGCCRSVLILQCRRAAQTVIVKITRKGKNQVNFESKSTVSIKNSLSKNDLLECFVIIGIDQVIYTFFAIEKNGKLVVDCHDSPSRLGEHSSIQSNALILLILFLGGCWVWCWAKLPSFSIASLTLAPGHSR